MARRTVKGHHCYLTSGRVIEIDSPNHVLWLGEFSGPFVNVEGDGAFLHGTAWRCPGMNEMVDGKTVEARGYCIITDADGDMCYLRWQADPATTPGELRGKSWWVGKSTGKYAGLTGENSWVMVCQIPPDPRRNEAGIVGSSDFEGWYELPGD